MEIIIFLSFVDQMIKVLSDEFPNNVNNNNCVSLYDKKIEESYSISMFGQHVCGERFIWITYNSSVRN